MIRAIFYVQSESGNQLTDEEFSCFGTAFKAMIEYSKSHPDECVNVGCCVPSILCKNGKLLKY